MTRAWSCSWKMHPCNSSFFCNKNAYPAIICPNYIVRNIINDPFASISKILCQTCDMFAHKHGHVCRLAEKYRNISFCFRFLYTNAAVGAVSVFVVKIWWRLKLSNPLKRNWSGVYRSFVRQLISTFNPQHFATLSHRWIRS